MSRIETSQAWTWQRTARRRLLSEELALHDVRDIEGLAGRVLEERLREWRASLPGHKGEEALSYLIGVAWELSLDHDSSRQAFSTRAYRTLRLRLVDWYRSEFGDSRHAPRPSLLSLDRALAESDLDEAGADASTRTSPWSSALAGDENVEEAVFHSAAFGLEWADLSLTGIATVREIGLRRANGESLDVIAIELGVSRRNVSERLEELRIELLAKRPDLPEWLG